MGIKAITISGVTVSQMAEAEKTSRSAIETRISRAGIKPVLSEFLYPIEGYEQIKGAKVGRPPKEKK